MDPMMSLNEVRFDVMKIQNKMLGFTVSVGLLPLISIVSSKGTVLGVSLKGCLDPSSSLLLIVV